MQRTYIKILSIQLLSLPLKLAVPNRPIAMRIGRLEMVDPLENRVHI